MRPTIWLLAIAVCAGCRAPMPSFKPYSNTRIPAPQTGEFGDPYYNGGAPAQPPTTAPATNQSNRPTNRSLSATEIQDAPAEDELAWTTPTRTRTADPSSNRYEATIRRDWNDQVQQADYESDGTQVRLINHEEPAQPYSPGSTGTSRANFRGMPVNDATAGGYPSTYEDDGQRSRSTSNAMMARLRGVSSEYEDAGADSSESSATSGTWKAR